MAFLTKKEIEKVGFANFGKNLLISDKCSIYNAEKISIGSNVRIDDFCILSAGEKGIEVGSNVHIACYVSLIGKELIKIGNYNNISSKTAIYSSSDDYSGRFLAGPMVPEALTNVDHRPVVLEDYVLIGSQCLVLPGVIIQEGTAIGAFSLVSKEVGAWSIYVGTPLRYLRERSKNMLNYL